MSNDMIRELFRSVETTLYERLRIIEDILVKQRTENNNPQMEGVGKHLHETVEQVKRVEEFTLEKLGEMNKKIDMWMGGMSTLEKQIGSLREELHSRNKVDDRPVELVQAQMELGTISAMVVEKNAKVALEKAVLSLPSSTHQVEEEEEEEEQEEEQEEEEEEVVEEEEEQEEVEEEEEEGETLTEFEFKGKTYYHDSEYKVYIPDEDGAISDPVGIYDPPTSSKPARIRRLPSP